MALLGSILLIALDVFFWLIIAQVVVSWLIAFEVVNPRNPQAGNVLRLLDKATDWAFKPLRRVIPPIGGIDITPIVVIFGIYLAKHLVYTLLMSA